MTMRDIANFENRIDAHVDGALVPGEAAYPFLDPLLEADDEYAAFAATFVLLRHGTENALARVRAALSTAAGKRLTGIGRALQMGRADALLNDLGTVFRADDAARTATAAEALSYHVRWKGSHDRLLDLLAEENPAIRKTGWRIVANLGIAAEPKRYAAAMRDDDATVREVALLAAAWTGVSGALGIARAAAATPSEAELPAYRLLAALGEPNDLRAIQRLVETPDLGPDRFALAAAYGSPSLAPMLLEALASDDPRTAIAAGEAFARADGSRPGARRAGHSPAGGRPRPRRLREGIPRRRHPSRRREGARTLESHRRITRAYDSRGAWARRHVGHRSRRVRLARHAGALRMVDARPLPWHVGRVAHAARGVSAALTSDAARSLARR